MSEVKQVIIWRHDLKVRKGKFGAQIAHASIAFLTNKMRYEMPSQGEIGMDCLINLSACEYAWIQGRFTKICVRVDSEEELLEVHQAALDAHLTSHLIQDAGLTEFNGVPTNTCVGIGPDYADKIDKITGHLQLL